jgi:hypothetical protein
MSGSTNFDLRLRQAGRGQRGPSFQTFDVPIRGQVPIHAVLTQRLLFASSSAALSFFLLRTRALAAGAFTVAVCTGFDSSCPCISPAPGCSRYASIVSDIGVVCEIWRGRTEDLRGVAGECIYIRL